MYQLKQIIKSECLYIREDEANPFFSSSLIWGRPPWSLHSHSHPRVSSITLRLQPDSRADKGQQRASGEPANSLSLSPACLSNRSMWARGHAVLNLSLALCALFNLCLCLGAPWRKRLLRRVSGKWGGEPRCRGAELDAYRPWQSWTSDDPALLLLTLHWAQCSAAASRGTLVSWPAATQTT